MSHSCRPPSHSFFWYVSSLVACHEVGSSELQSHDQDIPIDAHSIPESAKSPIPSVTLADTDQVVVKDHTDIDDDHNVYYLERSDIPGVCVESGET